MSQVAPADRPDRPCAGEPESLTARADTFAY